MEVIRIGGLFSDQVIVGGEDVPPFELIPAALADDGGSILGAATGFGNTCMPLPLWIWIAALGAYGFAVNWSLFPSGKNKTKQQSDMRTFGVPIAATAGSAIFWWFFRCDANLWFLISILVILLIHLLIKKGKTKKEYSLPSGAARGANA